MLYSRSMKDLNDDSQARYKRIAKRIFSWLCSTRFSGHIIVIILVALVASLASSPSLSQMYSSDPEAVDDGEYVGDEYGFDNEELLLESEEDELIEVDDDFKLLVSNRALVKPYIPITHEALGPNPFVKLYVVQGGDSLGSIANAFDITPKAIKVFNNLVTDTIKPGMELRIPPVEGVSYIVKNNDTVSSLASRFDISEEDIVGENEIVDPDHLTKGTELILPGVEPTAVPTALPPTPKPHIASNNNSNNSNNIDTSPPPRGSGRFSAPVSMGAVVQTQRYHGGHPGVDLASKGHKLIPIYASDGGTVTYSGWKGSYGNAVVINHGNGYYTLYGHMSSLFVRAGQRVSRGQAIGRMGTTGRSSGVHLHFEICTSNNCSGYSTRTRKNPRSYF